MSVGTSDPLIGRLIDGRYQVRSRIARGGMATVYLATDLRLERRVAVKIMHGHLADDSQFKRRFIQEARSAARLAHPNVVNVFDQGQDDDSAYLVMEYLSGITLRDLLHDYGALTPEQTLDITEAVLSGLAAAHRAGIVHRDLKPENVLLADDGRIKIGDFGLARAASANTATGAALLGTIAYLSPELVTRGVADARSDIYAVGIMVYEMLTGEQPYKGEQPMQIAYQHANDQVPAPSGKNGRVPAELDELVLWATARDPEDRPADAQELLTGLHDAEASLGTRPVGLRPGAQRPDRTAVLRTAVLPTPPRSTEPPRAVAADAATEVIGRRQAATAPVAPIRPGRPDPGRDRPAPAEALATVARKRRRRGWIVALVILLVVALGAGAGWWFALGPGARVGVPDVANLDPAAARTTLVKDGFTVAADPTSVYSLSVASSKVAGTSPKRGAIVAKGAVLTLLVSQGPRPWNLPKLTGLPVSDAITQVKTHWTSRTSQRVFNAAAKDTVVDALGADGASIAGAATYPEKQPITLVVSAGSVPDVAGKSVDEATKELTASELTVDGNAQKTYSDTVPKDAVIGLAQDPAKLTPGQTVTLVVSEGPPPVPVPSIVGQSWTQAKAALQSAGLKWKFKSDDDQAVATSFPDFAKVKSVDPSAGTSVPKGSTVTLTMSFSYNG